MQDHRAQILLGAALIATILAVDAMIDKRMTPNALASISRFK